MGGTSRAALLCAVLVATGMGIADDAAAGRAAACRRTCRDVLRSECGERLGLARPERRCKRDLLRLCRRAGVDVCRYPIVVGGWRFEIATCMRQCPTEPVDECSTLGALSFVFTQLGTQLTESERAMQGWFTDHASFAVEGTSFLGDTSSLRGTVVASDRITAVTFRVDSADGCWVERRGELEH